MVEKELLVEVVSDDEDFEQEMAWEELNRKLKE